MMSLVLVGVVAVSAPRPAPLADIRPETRTAVVETVWDRVADCESGDWIDGGKDFVRGSARWNWGAPGMTLPPWGTRLHDGGLQFWPSTWTAFRLDGYPARAYDASRAEQIAVAERVLAVQGWGAWPTCSRLLGLGGRQ